MSPISSSKLIVGRQPSRSRACAGSPTGSVACGARTRLSSTRMWLARVDAGGGERHVDELAHRAAHPAGQHVVAGLVLLDHQPRRRDDVARRRPVAHRVEVAEHQLVGEAQGDRAPRPS